MSAGRTKEEVRDLLAAGLEARGVTPPAGPVLDYLAGQALAGGDCPGELGLAAHGLSVLADMGAQIVRETRQALRSGGPHIHLDHEPLLVACDRSRAAADVFLDPDAQQWLSPEGDPSRAPEFSEIFVVLMAPDGPDELLAEVQAGQHRVGTLGHADSEEFRAIFAAGETQGRAVVGEAARTRGPNGQWALQVYRPASA
jgi:hypothetical protein